MGNKLCCKNTQQLLDEMVLEKNPAIKVQKPVLEKGIGDKKKVVYLIEENQENEGDGNNEGNSGMNEMKDKSQADGEQTGDPEIHYPRQNGITQLQEMPVVKNKGLGYINRLKGEFAFDQDQPENEKLPFLNPFKLENGEIYQGQWKNGQRHGRGTQIWPNNAVYFGYWKEGAANGFGRLIHADGDIYEG